MKIEKLERNQDDLNKYVYTSSLRDKLNEVIEVVNSLGKKEEEGKYVCRWCGTRYVYEHHCKEVKPSWEEEFDKEFIGLYSGYQKGIKDFIRKLLNERK